MLSIIREMLHANSTLKSLNIAANGFYEEGLQFLLNAMTETTEEGVRKNDTIIDIKLNEKGPPEVIKEIRKVLVMNKKKKRKKGKRKKGKKGKKGKR